jgi:molybdopterin molybdotransferase
LIKGNAIKIFTGARIPPNADAVIMQEYARERNGPVRFLRSVGPGENIRRRGDEFRKNDTICRKGTLITPPVIGLLSGLGYKKVVVAGKPRIALIVTGSELRSPGSRVRLGEIFDANSPAIASALRTFGIGPVFFSRTRDNKTAIRTALSRAFKVADVVISVGGVSVGAYDFVKEILAELGVKTVFWRVAMKPGKPNYFGMKGKKLVFGIPGNPVSALVSFHLLVKPALMNIMGLHDAGPVIFSARLLSTLRKKPGRMEFVRGKLTPGKDGEMTVMPEKGQDSHMLGGLASANCLVHFPEQNTMLRSGAKVAVSLLHWSGV